MDTSYNFRKKDPVIDVMRTLVQIFADIEGLTFNKALARIDKDTGGKVKFTTMYNWFAGDTMYPRYCLVARVILYLKGYARRPVAIGDTRVYVIPHSVRNKVAAHG